MKTYTLLVFFFCLTISTVYSQETTLELDEIMTPSKQEETGISNLSLSEKQALETWLTDFALRIYKKAKSGSLKSSNSSSTGVYNNTGSGHWISKNIDGGKYIKLEDGSLWEISSVDQVITSIWLQVSSITVIKADNSYGDYNYILLNTDDEEKASAKLINQ